MVDLALPQVNSIERQIQLTPLLCDIPSGFTEGRTPHRFLMAGCQVAYRAHPHKIAYQTTGDWCDRV